jgi:hypothetical protein
MRSARWQSIVDLPIVANRGLRHHRGIAPIFIGRGAPLRLDDALTCLSAGPAAPTRRYFQFSKIDAILTIGTSNPHPGGRCWPRCS